MQKSSIQLNLRVQAYVVPSYMVTMQKTDKNGETYQAKALLISFSPFLHKISIWF